MTTYAENKLGEGGMACELKRIRDERERKHLTVRKAVITKAVCSHCHHSWPYIPGDEDKPCPACHGGSGRFWALTGQGPSSRF